MALALNGGNVATGTRGGDLFPSFLFFSRRISAFFRRYPLYTSPLLLMYVLSFCRNAAAQLALRISSSLYLGSFAARDEKLSLLPTLHAHNVTGREWKRRRGKERRLGKDGEKTDGEGKEKSSTDLLPPRRIPPSTTPALFHCASASLRLALHPVPVPRSPPARLAHFGSSPGRVRLRRLDVVRDGGDVGAGVVVPAKGGGQRERGEGRG